MLGCMLRKKVGSSRPSGGWRAAQASHLGSFACLFIFSPVLQAPPDIFLQLFKTQLCLQGKQEMDRGHVASRWMAVEAGGQRRLRGGRYEPKLEGARGVWAGCSQCALRVCLLPFHIPRLALHLPATLFSYQMSSKKKTPLSQVSSWMNPLLMSLPQALNHLGSSESHMI